MMQHTKYLGSRPFSFRQEDCFACFPYISLCKTCDPQGGAISAPANSLNKLGRGLAQPKTMECLT